MWWVRSDPCGLFASLLTIFLILYSQCVVTSLLLHQWIGFTKHSIFYTFLTVLTIISHLKAQFTDPGAVPLCFHVENSNSSLNRNYFRLCRQCASIKPPSAHHCSVCNRCIVKMDHHCPWINNCVAHSNQKYFLLFLFYTFCLCLYSGSLNIWRFISCTNYSRLCVQTSTLTIALLVINFIEALIFGLFVIIMFVDQFSAIINNTPYIDQLQKKTQKRKYSKYELLKQVFGENFSLKWFLPLNSTQQLKEHFQAELTVRWQDDFMSNQFENEKTGNHPHHAVLYPHTHQSSEQTNNNNQSIHTNFIEYRSALERFTQLTNSSESEDETDGNDFNRSDDMSPDSSTLPKTFQR